MRRDTFTTIHTEGSILPADLLRRIGAGDADLGGLRPEDYDLAPGERLNEAANRSWMRLTGLWKGFRGAIASLGTEDAATRVTRERWLIPLFQELGYGRLVPERGAREIEGRPYPISHFHAKSPIHLVGCRVGLDVRTAGVAGASRTSPHGLVQEFLNRSDDHLWGIVTNGLRLRLLRDNASLTRHAFVEFQLDAMMDGEVYSDFVLLWLVCHRSRFDAERPTDCWLERWSQIAGEQGTRALDSLREGVQKAIATLGSGFLSHPANAELRRRLRDGALTVHDYYRQLLRLVYRLIFLFVAESRGLLCAPDADPRARALYEQYYSITRLRSLAQKLRGTRHSDLFQMLRLVMTRLGATGCPELALPALGGHLFDNAETPDLSDVRLSNADLLSAIHALAFLPEGDRRRPVDYRNLRSEELGSVYESLLELIPELASDGSSFRLHTTPGNERKTTGSYYTPDPLVQCLLDTALEPVIEERLHQASELAASWTRGFTESGNQASATTSAGGGTGNAELDLPGSAGLAAGHDVGGGRLQDDIRTPQERRLRADLSASPGSGVHPQQHSGGQWPRHGSGSGSLPEDSPGELSGTGDPDRDRAPGGLRDRGAGESTASPGHIRGQAPRPPDRLPDPLIPSRPGSPAPWLPASLIPSIDAAPPSARYSLLAENALLSLRVCDPAVGSGHFLIGAAHRIARRLAQVRTGDEEPSPEATRHALREVIGRCLYGVDINPMAVELCKVALWMEALEPGKPLSFLDHHIQCGNSLIGTTPALMATGIPDAAFEPIEGDDRAYCSELKRRNKTEREGGGSVFDADTLPWERLGDLAAAISELSVGADETLADVEARARRYQREVSSQSYLNNRLLADLWCAAFTWPKVRASDAYPPTQAMFLRTRRNPHEMPEWMRDEVRRLADEYRFFHWHLAFPDVFGSPPAAHHSPLTGTGFDVVLGNPPWEHTELKEKEFFAQRSTSIALARTGDERKRLIRALQEDDPALYAEYVATKRRHDALGHFCGGSGRYPLTGRGRINTYAIFAELKRALLAAGGRAGMIVPTGIATDDTTKEFFQDLMNRGALVSLYDFENGMRESDADGEDDPDAPSASAQPRKRRAPRTASATERRWFPDVDSRQKFCLLTVTTRQRPDSPRRSPRFAFFCHPVSDLQIPGKVFTLTAEDIALLNPNTRTCPVFRSRRDAEITRAIYRRVPVLIQEGDPTGNPWGMTFKQGLFNMTSDSHLFRTREELEAAGGTLQGNRWIVPHAVEVDGRMVEKGLWLPLYEAKMIHHFDHRWATYETVRVAKGKKKVGDPDTRDVTLAEKQDPHFVVMPRYWVHEAKVEDAAKTDAGWFVGWRDFTNVTNERTAIASVSPRVACGDTYLLARSASPPPAVACLLANWNAYAYDFAVRQKIGGVHLKYHYFKQMPVLEPREYTIPCRVHGDAGLGGWIVARVLELTYTAHDLAAFARDMGYDGPPFRWDEERRFLLRCELDAAFFHLYGIERDDVDYIMETFPIVKRKDIAAHGGYRTKETILAIYDAMQRAMDTGEPYQTLLDPPPANGWMPDEAMIGDWRAASGGAAGETTTGGREARTWPTASPRRKTAQPPLELPIIELDFDGEPQPPVPSMPGSMTPSVADTPNGSPADSSPRTVHPSPSAGDRVLVNDQPATLLAIRREPGGGIIYTVRLDGERAPRKFMSPPARIERE